MDSDRTLHHLLFALTIVVYLAYFVVLVSRRRLKGGHEALRRVNGRARVGVVAAVAVYLPLRYFLGWQDDVVWVLLWGALGLVQLVDLLTGNTNRA